MARNGTNPFRGRRSTCDLTRSGYGWLFGRSRTVTNVRVLICDDEPSIRELYRFAFEQAGCRGGRGGRRRRVHRDRSPRLPRRDRADLFHARARRSVGPPSCAVVPRCTGADGERPRRVEVSRGPVRGRDRMLREGRVPTPYPASGRPLGPPDAGRRPSLQAPRDTASG